MMVLRSVFVVATLAVLACAAPARAQDTLTPEGPATLAAVWRGAVPSILLHPGVIVRWSVTVGPGGQAGPVRLRNLAQGAPGARVELPAEPGTYTFAQSPGVPCDSACQLGLGLALDQSVGGHAIVIAHPSQPDNGPFADPHELYALDVFRPVLADGARGGEGGERHDGEELVLDAVTEPDADCDRLGDRTQDIGDLRLLDAWVRARRAGRVVLAARVRNAGATVRNLPRLDVASPVVPDLSCRRSPDRLAVGDEKVLELTVPAPGPTSLRVGAEGPDTTPGNNRRGVRPLLELARVQRRATGGLRVSATTSRAGSVRLSATIGGVRVARTVRLATAGRHTVTLVPRSAADRQRLAAALARNPTLTAQLTGTFGRTRAKLRARI